MLPHLVRHPRAEPLEHMVRERQPPARNADVRLEIRAAVKLEPVQRPAPRFLRGLLHHRQPRHQVQVRQRMEMQPVRAGGVEQVAERHPRVLEQVFVETVPAPVRAGDVARQRIQEFQVQRPVQQRQLVRVRIVTDVADRCSTTSNCSRYMDSNGICLGGSGGWRGCGPACI